MNISFWNIDYVLAFCHVIELFTAQNPFQEKRIFLFRSKTFDTRKENLQLKFGHVKVSAKTKLFWGRIIFVWFLLCVIDLSGILVGLTCNHEIVESKTYSIHCFIQKKWYLIYLSTCRGSSIIFIHNCVWQCSRCNEFNNCK